MAKQHHVSATPATQWLHKNNIAFNEFQYEYIDHGGAHEAAKQLNIELNQIAKTIILQDEKSRPLVVLMHGDKEISTKNLARQIKAKKVEPCTPETAQRNSGYQVGGTSPFATRKKMPIYIESTLLDYETIYINGGRKGYMISIASKVIIDSLGAKAINVANELHASN